MKKIFGLTLMFLFVAANCFADYESDFAPDMYKHPYNYICVWKFKNNSENHGVNTVYIEKNSINVQRYSPPYYIISFMTISHYSFKNMKTGKWEEHAYYSSSRHGKKYYYDYSSRKMYRELYVDKNGNSKWEYIDPNEKYEDGYSDKTGKANALDQGEIAFYLAYNRSFYDKPQGNYARMYIEKNISILDMMNFENHGTDLYNIYNHKAHEFEVWKIKYNSQSKDFNLDKIK